MFDDKSKGIFMSNNQINEPVSILTYIKIADLAESYRRKSYGHTAMQKAKNNSNISYSFKPAWNSWKNQDSAFYLKVTVSIYLQEKFLGSKFLWFYINATSNGIKAKCCEIPSIRFSLASRRFLATEFEKHSKKYCILPVTAYSGSQLSLAL